LPEVLIFPGTWKDPEWNRDFNRLPPAEKFSIQKSIEGLYEALQQCRHPLQDRNLKDWSPSEYKASPAQAKLGQWVKYRIGDREARGRVVIIFMASDDVIYLVGRTLTHDYPHLRELVSRFRVPKR